MVSCRVKQLPAAFHTAVVAGTEAGASSGINFDFLDSRPSCARNGIAVAAHNQALFRTSNC